MALETLIPAYHKSLKRIQKAIEDLYKHETEIEQKGSTIERLEKHGELYSLI